MPWVGTGNKNLLTTVRVDMLTRLVAAEGKLLRQRELAG